MLSLHEALALIHSMGVSGGTGYGDGFYVRIERNNFNSQLSQLGGEQHKQRY